MIKAILYYIFIIYYFQNAYSESILPYNVFEIVQMRECVRWRRRVEYDNQE